MEGTDIETHSTETVCTSVTVGVMGSHRFVSKHIIHVEICEKTVN